MKLRDKYLLLSLLSVFVTLLTGVLGYFVTYNFAFKSMKEQTVKNVGSFLELSAASVGSLREKEQLKTILESSPLVSKVYFDGENPKEYDIRRKLFFPERSVEVYLKLNENYLDEKASCIAKKVSLTLTSILFSLQLLLIYSLKKLYLNPLRRIKRDVKKIEEGKLERIPEEGEDEFGRIRKNLNRMIDSIKERDVKSEIVSSFIHLLTLGKGFNGEFVELMRRVLDVTGSDGVFVGVKEDNGKFRVKVITKEKDFFFEREEKELNGIEPYVLELEREVETCKESLFSEEEKRLGIRCIFGMPIRVMSKRLGYVIFFKKEREKFSEDGKNFIRNVVKAIGISVQIRSLISKLEEKLLQEKELTEAIIKSFVRSIEVRDSYTRGHSERVAFFAKRISEELGLSRERVEQIYMAALLHDVGKIGIPDSILLKPAKLSAEEYEIIKIHPVLSYEILKDFKSLKVALLGVKYHHERWDGSGYPEGLKGEEIPLEARILAVADTFDAMTSDRIYRKKVSKKEAIEEIKRFAGKLFDPKVVEVAIPIFLTENPVEGKGELHPYESLFKEIERRKLDYFLKDHLTGAFNRSALEYALSLAKEKCKDLSAFSVDIVKLREINIKIGWQEGDRLLKELVELIREKISPLSVVRYSGDNFVFFVPSSMEEKVEEGFASIKEELKVELTLVKLEKPEDVEKLKLELTELDYLR